ncbi:uncharacterized protein LOC131937040 [Physella acuta]|uniref:uncharacterized protein LOC131937040 n=1 Tax=Physella acuta TaxID=109671 RepID=UPI0027DDB515|nr:uncharacterized protein LOC131937040 [Physella acuta]
MNPKFAILLLVAVSLVLTTDAKSYRDRTKVRRPGLEDVKKPVLRPEAVGVADPAAPKGEMTGNIPDNSDIQGKVRPTKEKKMKREEKKMKRKDKDGKMKKTKPNKQGKKMNKKKGNKATVNAQPKQS